MRYLGAFYVNAFFIVSGYLFFRKLFFELEQKSSAAVMTAFAGNTFFRLIIPTVLFSGMLLVPKCIFNGRSISWYLLFHDVLGGVSFWFTSALAVAQLLLVLSIPLCRKSLAAYSAVGILLFCGGLLLAGITQDPFPWYYKSGMGCVIFMVVGGLYWKFEESLERIPFKRPVIGLLIVGYAGCCLLLSPANSAVIGMNFNVAGMIAALSSSFLSIFAAKKLKLPGYLEYIGKNSLSFYFMCGLFPALLATLAKRFIRNFAYSEPVILSNTILSLLLAFGVSFTIKRYLPFLLDIRKAWVLKKQ